VEDSLHNPWEKSRASKYKPERDDSDQGRKSNGKYRQTRNDCFPGEFHLRDDKGEAQTEKAGKDHRQDGNEDGIQDRLAIRTVGRIEQRSVLVE
jgi:hypothetical protein